ncbi:MAG: hypothetical protein U0S36_08620 [Candidatus Nanopelagicales bacterium]
MWVTSDGVQRVLALPDPADVLSPEALSSFAVLVASTDRDDLGLGLDDRLLALSDAGFEPDPDGLFVERAPAPGLLDGDLASWAGLDAALTGIDPRWQVDLLVALHALIDGLDEERP